MSDATPRIYGVPFAPVLLVGEAPSRTIADKPWQALVRPDLMELCGGIDLALFARCYRRCNLLDHWPGPDPHGGDLFPAPEGRAAARALVPYFAGHRVVLMGRRVETAVFGAVTHPWFEWFPFSDDSLPGPVEVAIAPHPSGINRFWNEEHRRAQARAFWVSTTADALIAFERRRAAAPKPIEPAAASGTIPG